MEKINTIRKYPINNKSTSTPTSAIVDLTPNVKCDGEYEAWCNWYTCNKCDYNAIIRDYDNSTKYCGGCGQLIVW